jgi:helix-turn-helix protein
LELAYNTFTNIFQKEEEEEEEEEEEKRSVNLVMSKLNPWKMEG